MKYIISMLKKWWENYGRDDWRYWPIVILMFLLPLGLKAQDTTKKEDTFLISNWDTTNLLRLGEGVYVGHGWDNWITIKPTGVLYATRWGRVKYSERSPDDPWFKKRKRKVITIVYNDQLTM